MNTISEIPLDQLIEDRAASVQDISFCEYALMRGVQRYGGLGHDEKSVQDRIESNKKIIDVIDAELKRREVTQ